MNNTNEMPPAAAVDLAGAVDYQDGAIVSRTLVKKNGGTVTLFAFDAGQGLSEHKAPFDALVHVMDGEAAMTVGGQEISARSGQAVLLPAGIPHSLKADKRAKFLLVMIREVAG